jgi:hypothetical protein
MSQCAGTERWELAERDEAEATAERVYSDVSSQGKLGWGVSAKEARFHTWSQVCPRHHMFYTNRTFLWLFALACSLNVPWMFPECSLNVPWMFPHLIFFLRASCSWDGGSRASAQLSLNVPSMFPECSLNVFGTHVGKWYCASTLVFFWGASCSWDGGSKGSAQLNWMFPECSLNAPCMFPECSLSVPWMFPEWTRSSTPGIRRLVLLTLV